MMRQEKKEKESRHQTTNRPDDNLSLLQAYSKLSRMECKVLGKMVEGKTNREIAEELFISGKTVENHITNIGNALHLNGRGNIRKWLVRRNE